jgi:hypothetical protein
MNLFMTLLLSASALAAEPKDLQDAVAQAQQESNGKILSAREYRSSSGSVYRIKLLTADGQVQTRTFRGPKDQRLIIEQKKPPQDEKKLPQEGNSEQNSSSGSSTLKSNPKE